MSVKEPIWDRLKAEVAEDFSLLSLKEYHENASVCYLIRGETLGGGDEEIGRKLLTEYFTTLANQRRYPAYIVLMNAGVKLLLKSSSLYTVLMELEHNGSAIFASALSAISYQLSDQIDPLFLTETGRIIQILHTVDKVICL